jgi:hypothetical protein
MIVITEAESSAGRNIPSTVIADQPLAEITETPQPPAVSTGDGMTPTQPGITLPPTYTPQPLALPAPASIIQAPVPQTAWDSLERLQETHYPVHDLFESARRLRLFDPGPRTLDAVPIEIGSSRSFVVDSGVIQSTLAAAGDSAYFWVESGLDLDQQDLDAAIFQFEREYLPRLESLFGNVWTPGMDNDPHFSVLHQARFESGGEIGYFDSIDEYPREIAQGSNEQEIVYLNMSALDVGDDLYYGTLVHETQHLIQWHMDGNETTWLDEGLAQLAETVMSLDSVDTFHDWLAQPDIQLNAWSYDDDDLVYAHYGGAYLLMLYFWEQLGDNAVYDLATHPANGMQSISAVLETYRPDSSLEQFLSEWAAAVYLDGDDAGPRNGFQNLRLSDPATSVTVQSLPHIIEDNVSPFGVHYIELRQSGSVAISFAGDTLVSAGPGGAASGESMWFVPATDSIDANLSGHFDLRNLASATLDFEAWYDLEPDYDFAYVTVSEDGGDTWSILPLTHSTAGEYGPAFNGASEDEPDNRKGWISESISLNRYVGQEIELRFEVLTDGAIRHQGFAVDNIRVPELRFEDDAERDGSHWQASGFVRASHQLPQLWSVQLIRHGDVPEVIHMKLDSINQGILEAELGRQGGTLVIMPQTDFVQQPASYWLEVR